MHSRGILKTDVTELRGLLAKRTFVPFLNFLQTRSCRNNGLMMFLVADRIELLEIESHCGFDNMENKGINIPAKLLATVLRNFGASSVIGLISSSSSRYGSLIHDQPRARS